jgi:transcriptional regulator
MYSPGFYREERTQPIHDLIKENPFATLLTMGGESVSHLPMLLETHEGKPCLVGHMARQNPHWQELQERKVCKVLFQGPHGYISPAWYAPKNDNVPTWNYTAVHIIGNFNMIAEPTQAFAAMDRLVNTFESKYQTGWSLPKGERAIEGLMKGIVVFKITDVQIEAKFKLSQKQSAADRENVIAQLQKSSDQTLRKLAEKMAGK